MSKIGFIYPSWMRAKQKLIDALFERKRDAEFYEIVDRWMKNFMFEIGFEVNVAQVEYYKHPEEMERHVREMAGRALAEEILKTNIYMRQLTRDNPPRGRYVTFPERTYAYTVLIAGVPECGVGPGTREARLLPFQDPSA